MQISFREWEDSAGARCAAASLGSDEVQVWTAAMPADEWDVMALTRTLSPSERERAERFRVPEPRRQFVFGRVLVRQILGACLDVDPATMAFGAALRGKPFLQSASDGDLRFNLSHSRSLMAVGLARGRDLGVDLEWIHQFADWSRVAARIFSAGELEELHALPARQQPEAFFNGWTRKEAYLKATGEGLTDALPAIEVALAPGQEPRLLRLSGDAQAARRWTLRAIPLPRGFAGAVAFETSSVEGAAPPAPRAAECG